jgi:hypothetical protein
MGITVQGNGGVVADVDGTTFRALRITPRPANYGALGIYRLGVSSGTMAANLAAGSEIFQFRWTSTAAFALVYKFSIGAGANVAATASAGNTFVLNAARSWTAAGTGGTVVTPTGDTCKLRTSMGATLVNEIRIASTTALGVGTKTLDTTGMGGISFGIGTGALTTSVPFTFLDQSPLMDADGEGWMPLVLSANEGFVIRTSTAFTMPPTMTWAFAVNAIWAEVTSY